MIGYSGLDSKENFFRLLTNNLSKKLQPIEREIERKHVVELKGKIRYSCGECGIMWGEGGKSGVEKARLEIHRVSLQQNKLTSAFVRNLNKVWASSQAWTRGTATRNTPTSGDLFRSRCLQSRCFFTSLEQQAPVQPILAI